MSASPLASDSASPSSSGFPLVVDLDGTLLLGDSLHESMVQLVREQPLSILQLPLLALEGRAQFKGALASRVRLDVGHLPYNESLLSWLRVERLARPVILCTAADLRVAAQIAEHLGCFDEVMASDGRFNLRGLQKAAQLTARFGHAGFDYVGNDRTDVSVFACARQAIVVNPTAGLRRLLSGIPNAVEPGAFTSPPDRWALLRLLRPYQWVKNILVFVPLLAAMPAQRGAAIVASLIAFVVFCCFASAGYVFNDLLDASADRRHPRKRLRPLAAATVGIMPAVSALVALTMVGCALAIQLPIGFGALATAYLVSTVAYSTALKKIAILDTLILSGLYTVRILGGAAAIAVKPSVWLLSSSVFFFLSLALAKRYAEFAVAPDVEAVQPGRRGYLPQDTSTILSQGTASGYAAVLVLSLYIDSDAAARYRHPQFIWLIVPLVLYWLNTLWLSAARRQLTDDPIVWAFRNSVSRAIGLACLLLLLAARFVP